MAEPASLTLARDHLAKGEDALMTADGLFHLQEGLALLESIADGDAGAAAAAVARNLGQAYTKRIYERIRHAIEKPEAVSEPELEHLFSVVRAFDDLGIELPQDSRAVKVAVVRRLIDYYYEGHSAAEKEKILGQLADLSGRG